MLSDAHLHLHDALYNHLPLRSTPSHSQPSSPAFSPPLPKRFSSALSSILERANPIVLVSVENADFDAVHECARAFADKPGRIVPAFGVHPWYSWTVRPPPPPPLQTTKESEDGPAPLASLAKSAKKNRPVKVHTAKDDPQGMFDVVIPRAPPRRTEQPATSTLTQGESDDTSCPCTSRASTPSDATETADPADPTDPDVWSPPAEPRVHTASRRLHAEFLRSPPTLTTDSSTSTPTPPDSSTLARAAARFIHARAVPFEMWSTDLVRKLREWPGAVVGEVGVDSLAVLPSFPHLRPSLAHQLALLRFQLFLARALSRPVSCHAVRTWGALVDVIRDVAVPTTWGAIPPSDLANLQTALGNTPPPSTPLSPLRIHMHSFTGSPDTYRALSKATRGNTWASFSIAINGRTELTRWRERVQAVDAGRLLVESDVDVPFPVEPLLRDVVEIVAEWRGWTPDECARRTRDNLRSLLGLQESEAVAENGTDENAGGAGRGTGRGRLIAL
ncbi:Metallo-dependent hydrolase [Gonapodya prolifera JEL478]|uniref:Metallo-dependent hydrolase n=1 Tax=Gonapodya prolifera (strain JEL478) TaxID=1344416 RepID=A0A139A391_GONPJ|nr:Metallo-dependent hydrolase [Gonapodya prolifera JEL478]|eukprot:KXS11286.1 Metallo-dependent hydrolase [Gonapodya prolifera JEL478]